MEQSGDELTKITNIITEDLSKICPGKFTINAITTDEQLHFQVPCIRSEYPARVLKFRSNSGLVHIGLDESIPRRIYIYYSDNLVTVKESTKLVTLGNFVSALGGNMGLFLGLSGVSLFLQVVTAVDMVMKKYFCKRQYSR